MAEDGMTTELLYECWVEVDSAGRRTCTVLVLVGHKQAARVSATAELQYSFVAANGADALVEHKKRQGWQQQIPAGVLTVGTVERK